MLPGILLFTVLADHAPLICLLSLTVVGALATYSIWSAPGPGVNLGGVAYPFPSLPFITALRTYTNLFTAIAILAVDFTIFPRRFVKAETYGTGLMDIGVGLFVVAHGLTSPEARGISDQRCVPCFNSFLNLFVSLSGLSVYLSQSLSLPPPLSFCFSLSLSLSLTHTHTLVDICGEWQAQCEEWCQCWY